MNRTCVWVLLSLLTACSSAPQGNSPQAICRREAYDDPQVKLLTSESMQASVMAPDQQFDYNQALHNAYQTCLTKHGVAVRGGVEAVRPSF